MASSGNGTGPHIAGELFKMMTSIDLVHIPYRGAGLALNDLLGGQVQTIFATSSSSLGYIQDGRLRALAVTTEARSDVLPDVPTVSEVMPGYEASTWYGLGASGNTPPEIIDRLNSEVKQSLPNPDESAAGEPWKRAAHAFARCTRQAHCRRNREMGKGGQSRRDPGELEPAAPMEPQASKRLTARRSAGRP
jgi:hypothetical protein